MPDVQWCLFCGKNGTAPDHLEFCDGRQGQREARMESPVLDPVESHRVTERGVSQAEDHAPDAWKEAMRLALHQLAYRQLYLTSDDLWDLVGTAAMGDANPSALGGVFRTVAREGLIRVTTDRQESQRPACHRRPLRVWESLVYRRVSA